MNCHIDVIGDIHGHADELEKLLTKLGYKETATGFQHPTNRALFLGDFIDRGESLAQHKRLLDIVMNMVDNDHAMAVMGNHEFNALAYHTKVNGDYLRPHTSRNQYHHQAFLNEFPQGEEQTQEVLEFFYRLPLWLELPGLRAVHACWSDTDVTFLQGQLDNGRLTKSLLVDACNPEHTLFRSVETILKGVEISLPEGLSFVDKSGTERKRVRARWWRQEAKKLADVVLPETLPLGEAAHKPVPKHIPLYNKKAKPCFIGHYWFSQKPAPAADNVACLDYSVASGGQLTAYRWRGESKLKASHFISAR